DPVLAGLAAAFGALRSALAVSDRLDLLPCGAGPGLNAGDPVVLEITCAVDRTDFHLSGAGEWLEHHPQVSAVEYWSAGEQWWLHLHTDAAGPVLQELTARVPVHDLTVTRPRTAHG